MRTPVQPIAWANVDPVLSGASPLQIYEPGSWGPPEADAMVAGVGGWNTPDSIDAALHPPPAPVAPAAEESR